MLGPLEVSEDGRPLPLGGAKQRALLALLLLHRNEVVASERLIDELWGERPPRTAHAAIQVYVSGLRKVVSSQRLLSRPPGYVLVADEVDVDAFGRLVDEARAADSVTAAQKLRDALSLWRGDALADFRYEPFAQAEIARLEEARLTALEMRIEADLALGRHAEVVAELGALVARHPHRERLHEQLMLSLYRAGRQADALQVYHDARRALLDELGLDPSPSLRRLEGQILAQDAALDITAGQRAAIPPKWREGGYPLRKTVTVVVCELECSDGDEPDAEVLARTTPRYSAAARAALARHGGAVEETVGHVLVGFFGLDAVHEDDALRAVRAAVDVRQSFGALNAEADAEDRVSIAARLGVATRDVVVADTSRPTMAAGPAVDSAVRLQRSAHPGDILISDATLAVVRDRVTIEPAPRADARTGAAAAAHAVADVPADPGARRRRHSPLVGRDRERKLLDQIFERTLAERVCHRVTVVGAAGVGKSRLVAEFVRGVASRARVVGGRCLSYGDGITFFPLAQVVREALGVSADASPEQSQARLEELVSNEKHAAVIARRVAEVVGSVDDAAPAGERPWAIRKLLEALARREPLVVVFDDVQWGEPMFLDLVEEVVAQVRDAPMVVVCIARPELLEVRPGWGETTAGSTAIPLEPLTEGDSEQLIKNLIGGVEGVDLAARCVAEVAEGNPFFVEELLAMLIERGQLEHDEARWHLRRDVSALGMPPTIQAVLAARLDRLPKAQLASLQRASVEGKVFRERSVVHLTPDEARPAVAANLEALARTDLIRPEPRALARDDTFSFRHQLIRDAAYASLPKTSRAELHEEFADWLERTAQAREPDREALLGHHLERAYRYREELGLVGERANALAERAARALAAAARTAVARYDDAAAVTLLGRAVALVGAEEHAERAPLLVELGTALSRGGSATRAELTLDEAIETARRAGDESSAWMARILRGVVRDHRRGGGLTREGLENAVAAVPVLEALGDDRALAEAWYAIGHYDGAHDLRCAEAERASIRARAHAQRAGDARKEAAAVTQLAFATARGPTPVAEAIRRCEELRATADGDVFIEASVDQAIASLEAGRGNLSRAQCLIARVKETFDDLGLRVSAAVARVEHAGIARMSGDDADGERELRAAYDTLKHLGEGPRLAMVAAMLSQNVAGQGSGDEAASFLETAEELAFSDDAFVAIHVAMARARVAATRGDYGAAEAAARDAVTRAQATDALVFRGEAFATLGDILRLAGRDRDAVPFIDEAARVYEQKGYTVAVQKIRAAQAAAA